MGWWPFGRRDGGRHALGAAVTSLPTGPLVLPVVLPPVAEPAAPVLALDADARPREQLEALLGLLGGDRVGGAAVPDSAPLAESSAAAPTPVLAPTAPSTLAPSPTPAETVAADALVETRVLETPPAPALLLDVPLHPPPPFVPSGPPLLPALHAPRVELGFRDGSTTALQPGSEQARALEDLARALTSR